MKRIKLFILALTAGVMVTTSCEFGDINVDPTQLSDATLKDILPLAIGQTLFNNGAEGGRAAGHWIQQFIGYEAQQGALYRYLQDQENFNNLWSFGLYAGSMKDCTILIEKGTEEGQPYYVGIAKVLMAANLGMVTQCWGDAPYTEAFRGDEGSEFFKPAYDTQESLYASIQTLLDEGIAELSKPAVSGGPAGDDLMFSGNAARWIATAYALKARYSMHLVKRDNASHTKALSALTNAFTSNATEPLFNKFGSRGAVDANPLGQFGAQRPNTLFCNPAFNASMTTKGDPRVSRYMAASGSDWLFYTAPAGLFWSSYTSPSILISYAEVKFIEAEARLRNNDVAGAEAALAAGITANMDRLGIAAASYAAYVAAYGNFTGLTTFNQRLERIMQEKSVALYGYGFIEAWTDFRRTGYPVVTPVPGGANGSNPSGVVPRRFLYVSNETFSNTENVEAAKTRQGGDLGDVDLWAFKN